MPTLRLILVRVFPALGGGGSSYDQAYYKSGPGGVGGGGHVSGGRTSQKRTLVGNGNLTSRSTHTTTVQPGDSADTVVLPKSGAGIVRHQTFAVQYDDGDETSLVQMRGLAGSAISHKSDDLA